MRLVPSLEVVLLGGRSSIPGVSMEKPPLIAGISYVQQRMLR